MHEMPTMVASSYASQNYDPTAMMAMVNNLANARGFAQPIVNQPERKNTVTRRLIQVFIADPNENVPLEDSLLYRGEQKLTDLTDQELFFEVDVRALLEKHNEKRVKLINKSVKERTEHLEPARIRDLKMIVTTVAQF